MRNLFLLWILITLCSCAGIGDGSHLTYSGETMGTYYKVTFRPVDVSVEQAEIDQLLVDINQEVSTYIDTSTISLFNQAKKDFELKESLLYSSMEEKSTGHFMANFLAAREIYQQTEGYFEPTVMPLVNYWGFGYSQKKPVEGIDSVIVDSLLQFVGFDRIRLRSDPDFVLYKASAGIQLDFSAIAKGYAVDEIGKLLESYGCVDYFVDIGGEIRANGLNAKERIWMVGINVPKEGSGRNEIQVAVPLENQSIATSGNYRNYYEMEGEIYSHTINPKTGFPERNRLLSASVFAEDCMIADAYATAFMTMGLEKAFELATELKEIEAYFIYATAEEEMEVKYTSGLKELFD